MTKHFSICFSIEATVATETDEKYIPWVVSCWMSVAIHHKRRKPMGDTGREEITWLALMQFNSQDMFTHSVRCSCTSHSWKLPIVCVDTNSFYQLKHVHYETSNSFLTLCISQIPGVTSSFTPLPSVIHSFIRFHTVAFPGGRCCCDWVHNWASGAWGREEI